MKFTFFWFGLFLPFSCVFTNMISITTHRYTDYVGDNSQDVILQPIHAAPPEQRMRLSPPLLKPYISNRDRSSNTNNGKTMSESIYPTLKQPVRDYSKDTAIVGFTPKKPADKIEKMYNRNSHVKKANDTLWNILKVNSIVGKVEQKPEKNSFEAYWSPEQIEYLLDELQQLERLVNEKKRDGKVPIKIKRSANFLLPSDTPQINKNIDFSNANSDATSSKKLESRLNLTTSNLGPDSSLKSNPSFDGQMPSYPHSSTATVQISPRLENGPIETLLKQDGTSLENVFGSTYEISGNDKSLFKNTVIPVKEKSNLPSYGRNSFFQGSNIPFYPHIELEKIQQKQLEEGRKFFNAASGQTAVLPLPLSQMVPTSGIYRVNVTVRVSDNKDPHVSFPQLSTLAFRQLKERSLPELKFPASVVFYHELTALPVMKLQGEFPIILTKHENFKIVYPYRLRSYKADSELSGFWYQVLDPNVEKYTSKTIDTPFEAVHSYMHKQDRESKEIKKKLIKPEDLKLKKKFKPFVWRWRSREKGIADLIGQENESTKEFQNEYDNEKENEVLAREENGKAPPAENHGDLNRTIEELVKKGEVKGARDIAKLEGAQKNERILKLISTIWLKKWWYIGQCIRDYSRPCPKKWEKLWDGTCLPPQDYSGICESISFENATDSVKEAFALSCTVEWPCIHSPGFNFSFMCPLRWENPGMSLCIAPTDYQGPCSPATDFQGFTNEEKSIWASTCGAEWPPNNLNAQNRKTYKDFLVKEAVKTLKKSTGRNGPVNSHTGLISSD